jgi:hypothetical protein
LNFSFREAVSYFPRHNFKIFKLILNSIKLIGQKLPTAPTGCPLPIGLATVTISGTIFCVSNLKIKSLINEFFYKNNFYLTPNNCIQLDQIQP